MEGSFRPDYEEVSYDQNFVLYPMHPNDFRYRRTTRVVAGYGISDILLQASFVVPLREETFP